MSKSKVEIIDETAQYIEKNGRAKGDYKSHSTLKKDSCVYRTTNKQGKKIGCAIGRVMLNEEYSSDLEGLTASDFERSFGGLDQFLKPEYRGHSIDFWEDLQGFHDSDSNWDETDHLTETGKAHLVELKEFYRES